MPRRIAAQYARQDLLSRLDQSLSPARLLRFESRHLHRQLGGTLHILQVNELPSLELGPVGKISILGKRVVLPAASLVNGRPPPHPGGAVEIEENSAAGSSRVFQHKMPIQQNRLHLRAQRIIAVDAPPPPFHHPYYQ